MKFKDVHTRLLKKDSLNDISVCIQALHSGLTTPDENIMNWCVR